MNRQSAVLFDFDGTLFFGTHALNSACFAFALEKMGLPPAPPEKIHHTVGMTLNGLSRFMLDSDDPDRIRLFQKYVFEQVPRYIREEVRPIPGEREMLLSLRKEAYVAICSNAAPDYLLPLLDKLEIRDCFDLVWHHTPGWTKADAIPEIMKRLNVSRTVFAGDRLEDVRAAHSAGIPICGIINPAFPEEMEEADTVSSTLDELFSGLNKALQVKEE